MPVKNILITFILLCFTISIIFAQTNELVTVIQYKDGSVFVGEVLDQDVLQLTMVLTTSDTITLQKSKILKNRKSNKFIILDKKKEHNVSDFFYNLDLSLNSNGSANSVMMSLTAGKRLSPKFNVGAGLMMSHNTMRSPNVWGEFNLAQLFVHGRYNMNEKPVRPFIEANVGWGVALNSDDWNSYSAGFYASPGIGLEIATKRRLSWTIKINQYVQNISGTQLNWFTQFDDAGRGTRSSVTYDSILSRTAFSVGINF